MTDQTVGETSLVRELHVVRQGEIGRRGSGGLALGGKMSGASSGERDTWPVTDQADDSSDDLSQFDVETIVAVMGRMQSAQQEMNQALGEVVSHIMAFQQPHQQLWDEVFRVSLAASKRLQENLPTNWPKSRLSGMWKVLEDDGIPVVYVPRAETVRAILDGSDYESRMRVLVGHRISIADDCLAAMDRQDLHPSIADLGGLIREAQSVLAHGYFAGAQCLAVNVCDVIVRRTVEPKWKYPKIVKTIEDSGFDDELLSVALAFRPVLSFYAEYTFGDPNPPVKLNRHRTAHEVSPDHTSEHNATIAVMLATSLALAVTDWRTWIDLNPAE